MIQMTLRQLRYFDALARHGHFGRAAEACSISQPALSMQIKEMEEVLGGVLLERSARQVTLTKFGEEIVQRVRDILRSVDELGDFARASRDRLAGRLRIGMIPTIAPYLLPKVIENLARMHPELDIHVRETLTPKLIKEVVEGRLDTAIVALAGIRTFADRGRVFFGKLPAGAAGRGRGNAGAEPRDAARDAAAAARRGTLFPRPGAVVLQHASSPPREVLDASSLSTLVQMVGAGIGVTLIPEMAVAVETRSASVSVARFRNPQPSRTIGMVWRKTSPLAGQLQQISEVVCLAADALREQRKAKSPSRKCKRA